ncbi:unnamed protein product [Staurois parvus]|uniref:Uncharacterized protein n=1 Tax=Staurois parvus TaxID=386267 RepID=A0ABN9FZU9_9NEOB|nr:unnamed protein product [Staurois parvus]
MGPLCPCANSKKPMKKSHCPMAQYQSTSSLDHPPFSPLLVTPGCRGTTH